MRRSLSAPDYGCQSGSFKTKVFDPSLSEKPNKCTLGQRKKLRGSSHVEFRTNHFVSKNILQFSWKNPGVSVVTRDGRGSRKPNMELIMYMITDCDDFIQTRGCLYCVPPSTVNFVPYFRGYAMVAVAKEDISTSNTKTANLGQVGWSNQTLGLKLALRKSAMRKELHNYKKDKGI